MLVGGGDPTLAAGAPPATDYPQPATLLELARRTAQALIARGRHTVRLGYDSSLYTGPALGPRWPASYVTTGNVSAITALSVDQGRVTMPAARPPTTSASSGPRAADPAAVAAAAFASFLSADGITRPRRGLGGRGPRARAHASPASSHRR